MAKQRDLIRMTEAETAAFIEECRSMVVATLGKDGAPHLTTLWFAVEDGTYIFETYGTSQKVVNLRRDPRISLMWEAGTEYGELRGVTVQGRAEIVGEGPRLLALIRQVMARNAPRFAGEALDRHVAGMARKRVAIVVHPEKTISWDHRKLAAAAP
ncbi:pyridoxamine 5'-phosphate oxidase family protein [Phenylobacterium sp.]|jgi:PPOX class probable F420-dependent enzyme|uniref:pyridoxamine 5'-phosphate oxidase family protein n=1 Tax=Phenylobacterium sp. TaxID=1871053 RepID=UPI002F41EF43